MSRRNDNWIAEFYHQACTQALSELQSDGSDQIGSNGGASRPVRTQANYTNSDRALVVGDLVGLPVSKTQRDTMDADEWLTYPSEIACEMTQVLGLNELDHVHRMMQENHERISRQNAVNMLMEFANDSSEISQRIHANKQNKGWHNNAERTLNEPTWEALKTLKSAGVPTENAKIFATTATANSGNECAIIAALGLLGVKTPNATLTSTVRVHGKTGVSNVAPLHRAIYYDQYTKRG